MILVWITAALFAGSVPGAQQAPLSDTPAVEHRFAQQCDVVRPPTLAYFQQEALPLVADATCTDCLTGTTKRLHNEAGHRLLSNRNAIRQYTTYDLRYHKIGPVTQIVHWDLRTDAKLRFVQEGSGCRVSLHFGYHWYGAWLVLGFPVDGDGEGAYSNGKLESAYLYTLQQRIDKAAQATNTRATHYAND